MNSGLRIVLVGGGLVGSLLAVMLGRRGHAVTVYEKRPDLRRTRISAGRSINLALAERGRRALHHAGLMDEVEPLLIPMRGRMLHPAGEPASFSLYGQRPHEVIYSVSRGLLNQVMLVAAEQCPGTTIRFQTECRHVDLPGQRLQLVDLSTGQPFEAEFDLVLGTDGAASAVRNAVALATGGSWHTDWLDHDYKELEIPAGADGKHQLDPSGLHIWPRHGFMLIALPNLDGSFTVTLFLNKSGSPSFAELQDPAAVERFFHEYFPDARALIPDLAGDFFGNPTGALGTVRCSRWTDGRQALLLGDAAHAIVPFHGQGMNAGFEDCLALDQLLEAGHDWPAAMTALEQQRRPAADAIADMALENYITMRDSVLDPRFQLKKEVGFALERMMPDRFIPKYSMVMFHSIPYDLVRSRGALQEEILDQLTEGKSGLAEVDLAAGQQMAIDKLPALAVGSI